MWPLCTANSLLWLLLPLLIGLLTGWWAWSRRSVAAEIAGGEIRNSAAATQARNEGAADARAYSSLEADADRARSNVQPFPIKERASAPSGAVEPGSATVPSAATAGATALGIPAAVGESDDLHRIKGVGPKLNELLQSLGIRRFDQIAAWGPGEIAKVDSHLGAFRGRIERDNWVEQAKLLARGAFEEFEARFGGANPSQG